MVPAESGELKSGIHQHCIFKLGIKVWLVRERERERGYGESRRGELAQNLLFLGSQNLQCVAIFFSLCFALNPTDLTEFYYS